MTSPAADRATEDQRGLDPDQPGREGAEREAAFRERFRYRVGRYRAKAKLLAWVQAEMMDDLADIARMRPPPDTVTSLEHDEFAPEDVAVEVGVSPATAAAEMMYARIVSDRLPHALDALRSATIDLPRLRSLERAVRPLDNALAAAVEAHVLAGGPRPTRRAFTEACHRAVCHLDPDGAAERARRRRADRRVWTSPDDDGVATLSASLPAEEAHACYQRINHIAHTITTKKPAEDTRTSDQVRADVLVDLLTGRAHHAQPLPCDVQVIVPAATLLGLTDHPGEIPGVGLIPAAIAREMAHRSGSTWRRILTDPQGDLVEIADRRFPSPAQTRHIQARDRTCRIPGCDRPARRCDLDHTLAHSEGGPTVTANLGPLCRRHHRMKTRRRWTLTQPSPGTFCWTTTLGHQITVVPHPYLHPEPAPPMATTNSEPKKPGTSRPRGGAGARRSSGGRKRSSSAPPAGGPRRREGSVMAADVRATDPAGAGSADLSAHRGDSSDESAGWPIHDGGNPPF